MRRGDHSFDRILQLFKDIQAANEKKNQKQWYRNFELERLVKSERDVHWRRALSLFLSMNSNNKTWVRKNLKELLGTGPYRSIFGQQFNVSEKLKNEWHEVFEKSVERMRELLGEELTPLIFVDRIAFWHQDKKSSEWVSQFGADWSLTELREILKNPRVGHEHIDYWYFKLVNRTSDFEVKSILAKVLSAELIGHFKDEQLWLFQHFFPRSDDLREIIIGRLVKMWNGGDVYQRFIVLQCMKNSVVRNELGKKSKELARAYFQVEREYYREVLNAGKIVDFSLYNLVRLGDREEKNLWWLVL
jgi:hypothetical protein